MKLPSITNNGIMWFAVILAASSILLSSTVEAAPSAPSPGYYAPISVEGQNPEYILQALVRLRQALNAEEDLENTKRGIDLGLGRGYSGSQAAKHLMGLAAANFAGGPGRRRRSVDDA
ncbi:hypothetical protein PPYR_05236 [Photinus pyralis]|uniref:Calcitonin peptide-like domain-containing protein n=1 Tax=Photinus pyralis TaxID=7054 RepID=A0A1Y1N9W2_PHOPY|nr:diuretic hormone class 2 isoform X2 [Photinus pyralis]KAB0800882.1 hypothetical protein PPYR_05236 [Photinus pyralis]